jgi:hypothetical protein
MKFSKVYKYILTTQIHTENEKVNKSIHGTFIHFQKPQISTWLWRPLL